MYIYNHYQSYKQEPDVIITDEAYELIKSYEGLKLKPYLCPGQYWTIGYGRRVDKDHPPITKRQAKLYLIEDIERFERKVLKYVDVPITRNQLSALVSFTYNLGEGALQRSTLLRKLNRGDYVGAQKEFHRWVHADGKRLRGLVKRRAAEAALFGKDSTTDMKYTKIYQK